MCEFVSKAWGELEQQTIAKGDKLGQSCSFDGHFFTVSLVAIVWVSFIRPHAMKNIQGEKYHQSAANAHH